MENKRKRKKIESKKKSMTTTTTTYIFEFGSFENILPMEIIFDIFSRLPYELVLACRRVCKPWRKLIYNPSFAYLYLQSRRELTQLYDDNKCNSIVNGGHGQVGIGLIFAIRFLDKDKGNVQLYYGEYDENRTATRFSYKELRKINHPPVNKKYDLAMVSSCNGLICFSVSEYPIYDPVYICNPITREYVNLPSFNIRRRIDYWTGHMVYGFGYHPSSNVYKVVRIYYHDKRPTGEVQVYILGDGRGWRKKRKVLWSLSAKVRTKAYPPPLPGILANGALHWMNKELKIVAFDLGDEEFSLVTPPPCFLPAGYNENKHSFQLRELGGCLCVVHQVRHEYVDIWSLKKTNNISSYSTKEEGHMSWSWSREFNIKWEGQSKNEYEPFALTKSGEVLLWFNRNILSRYDPKTKTLRKLVVGDGTALKFFQGIPHMNSFVSLKALGERCKTRRSYTYKKMISQLG